MSWSVEEAEQVTRIEVHLEAMVNHEPRISALERYKSYIAGALYVIGTIGAIAVAVYAAGCATAHTRCFYNDTGYVTYTTSRSTVVGKGLVTATTTACATLDFNASEGGFNPEALEAIATGAVRGLMP